MKKGAKPKIHLVHLLVVTVSLTACTGEIGDPRSTESEEPDAALPDVYVEDTGPEPDVDPLARAHPFSESCALPFMSCLSGAAAPTSCTINGGTTDLAYPDAVSMRLERRGAATDFGIYQGGELCAEGSYPVSNLVPIEPQPGQPPALDTWRFANRDGEVLVQLFEDWVLVQCPDGGFDRHPLEEVIPFLPSFPTQDDAPCVRVESAECQASAECGGVEVCCPTAASSRCLLEADCPVIGPAVALGPCLAPMFECYGARTAPSACVSGDNSPGEVTYPAGQRLTVNEDGGVWSVIASVGDTNCYAGELSGTANQWETLVLQTSDGSSEAHITIEGDVARVVCDGVASELPARAVMRHVPEIPDMGGTDCLQGCSRSADCPGGSCCPGPSGGVDRCMPVPQCFDPSDPLLTSCLVTPLMCFGRDQTPATCEYADWAHLQFTDVSYESGGEALFFVSMGRESAIASASAGVGCFELSKPALDHYILNDVFARTFQIELSDGVATITCPDGEQESLVAEDVLAYLPVEPDPIECLAAERFELCTSDADCGVDMICCDQGAFTDCLPSYATSCLQPARTCSHDSDCDGGQACCEADGQRVCDIGLCGSSHCCDVDAVAVCQEAGACP